MHKKILQKVKMTWAIAFRYPAGTDDISINLENKFHGVSKQRDIRAPFFPVPDCKYCPKDTSLFVCELIKKMYVFFMNRYSYR